MQNKNYTGKNNEDKNLRIFLNHSNHENLIHKIQNRDIFQEERDISSPDLPSPLVNMSDIDMRYNSSNNEEEHASPHD